MKKRGTGMVHKMITGIILTMMVVMFSGCDDSELEQKNIRQQTELTKSNMLNSQLGAKIKELTDNNKNLKKELDTLRSNNKELDVSLAKSELLFSKKHKAELEAERDKLDGERESLRQEKQKIEKEAYKNAEVTVSNKYLMVLGVIFIVLIVLFLYLWRGRKEEKSEVKRLKSEIENERKEKEVYRGKMNELTKSIEELERKQQEGCINQVISKINTASTRRKELLESLRGDEYGN